jgi:hypothetical protein
MNDVGDGPPLADVGTLEGLELGGLIKDFALTDDELMQREHVHELVVGSGCCLGCVKLRRVLDSQCQGVIERLWWVTGILRDRGRQG